MPAFHNPCRRIKPAICPSDAPIALRTHESETADAACSFLSTYSTDDRVPFAHEAIAIAKRKCANLSTDGMCEMAVDCDGGLCTEAEVLAEIRGWRDGCRSDVPDSQWRIGEIPPTAVSDVP